jgi:PadR family transcriptional regulator PadR
MVDLDQWLAQLRRGTLELCVLRVLRRGDAHGYEIVQRLKRAEFLTIREGTVYPVLQRLLRDGLVKAYEQKSEVGPPRKCFTLTERGVGILGDMEGRWRTFVKSVDSLKKEREP